MRTLEQAEAECSLLHDEVRVLRAQLEWFKKQIYGGGKSEKLDRLQSDLPLPELPVKEVEVEATEVKYVRIAKPKAERSIPVENFKNIPVKETVIIEPEEVKANPEAFVQIGEERTFEIDIIAPQLFKREIVRPKYKSIKDTSRAPIIAAAPERAVMGGYASAGLLAWIALSKYVDHQPLYRLEKQSERWGANIPRQTMADWIRITAEWLEPIYKRMHQRLLEGSYLQVDETPVRCNDPDEKNAGTKEGWLWVVSRPGSDVVFDWRLSRKHGELTSLVEGFSGILQSDAYAAYFGYAKNHPEVKWVGCWAHARRKFFEAKSEDPKAVAFVLRIIGWMYETEALMDSHKLSAERRAYHRKKFYPRKLYWLKKVVIGLRAKVLPKSGLGKASDYMLKYWEPLVAHIEHGETRIDNNLVENAIRPSAIGKKNWLFIGHPEAGQRSAIIYSIVVSCQGRGIDPLEYMRDVLTKLPKMTTKDDLDALTPALWKNTRN
jgi:transposase